MPNKESEPIPPQGIINPEAYASFLEILSVVQESVFGDYPEIPLLTMERIRILPRNALQKFLLERDQASAHPFYWNIARRSKHDKTAFDSHLDRTAFYSDEVMDYIKRTDRKVAYPEIGLHLVASTIDLAPHTVILDSPESKIVAENLLKRHLLETVQGSTNHDLKKAINIIRSRNCEVKVYGAESQIWVDGKIFSPPIGTAINRVLMDYFIEPVNINFVRRISKELNLTKEEIQYLLNLPILKPKAPATKQQQQELISMYEDIYHGDKQQMLQGLISGEIGHILLEAFYTK